MIRGSRRPGQWPVLDDLRVEFERLKAGKDSRRRGDLRRCQEKLGRMTFFDPLVRVRDIGGRLKSDYRYSIGLVYSTFPTPTRWANSTRRCALPGASG